MLILWAHNMYGDSLSWWIKDVMLLHEFKEKSSIISHINQGLESCSEIGLQGLFVYKIDFSGLIFKVCFFCYSMQNQRDGYKKREMQEWQKALTSLSGACIYK